MMLENYILALTTGFLTAPDERMPHLWKYFGASFVLDETVRSGAVSIAGEDVADARLPFHKWIARQRDNGVARLRIGLPPPRQGRTPAHKLAGFAGARASLLEVQGSHGIATYALDTVLSPSNSLRVAGFISLINQQEIPSFYWDCICDQVNEYNAVNQHDWVEREYIERYLGSPEGRKTWEKVISDEMFREIQVEALTFDQSFVIPEAFRKFVRPVERSPFFNDLDSIAFLYAIDDDSVTGEQLVQLVEAQDFAQRIWTRCADAEQIGRDFELPGYDFPELPAHAWPPYLRALPQEGTEGVVDVVIDLIRQECESGKVEPKIPEELACVFGPDEIDRRRIHFRERLQHDTGWMLNENEDRWQLYLYRRLPPGADTAFLSGQRDALRTEFDTVLARACEFSMRRELAFADTFRLAKFLSEQSAAAECDVGRAALQQALAAAGNWEAGMRLLDEAFPVIEGLSQFGWGADKVCSLAAISVADQFGAMGSWNDQGFDGIDQEHFEEISARLFSVINSYFAALLSFP